MGLSINTNISALDALFNLDRLNSAVSSSIEKLSSGSRINTAADDPSGLTISERLRAQVAGVGQAIANSQGAINLVKTAGGGLTEVSNLLLTIRQLAVHAANTGVNDQSAVHADQLQIDSAVASIERIATQTQFGGSTLLDGSAGTSAVVVNNATISGIHIGGSVNGVTTGSGDVHISVEDTATQAQVSGAGLATYASVNDLIENVNGLTDGAGGTVVLNGQSVAVSGSDTVQTLIDRINDLAGTTGVVAGFVSGNGSGAITLTQETYGSNFGIQESESSPLLIGPGGTQVYGMNATVTALIPGIVNGALTSVVATFVGGRQPTDSGLRVTDGNGNSILLTEPGNSIIFTSDVDVATLSAHNLQFHIGGNADQTVTQSFGNVRPTSLGTTVVDRQSLGTIDVTTAQGAQEAIQIADDAISQVSQLRADLGNFQSQTLSSTINYLGISHENLSASESAIRDTNVAQEVVNLTRSQILQQTSNFVLSQANQSPRQLLKLLQ